MPGHMMEWGLKAFAVASGVTTPGQLWAMPRLPFGRPRLPCPQIDKTFYVTPMLLISCPGCSFTLVTPLAVAGHSNCWSGLPIELRDL